MPPSYFSPSSNTRPSTFGNSTPKSLAIVGATSQLLILPSFAPGFTPCPHMTSVPSKSGWSGR